MRQKHRVFTITFISKVVKCRPIYKIHTPSELHIYLYIYEITSLILCAVFDLKNKFKVFLHTENHHNVENAID